LIKYQNFNLLGLGPYFVPELSSLKGVFKRLHSKKNPYVIYESNYNRVALKPYNYAFKSRGREIYPKEERILCDLEHPISSYTRANAFWEKKNSRFGFGKEVDWINSVKITKNGLQSHVVGFDVYCP